MDVTIRSATTGDARGIARVRVDAWRETYTGIVPASYLATLDHDRQSARWAEMLEREPPWVYVAADELGEVVGYAAAYPTRTEEDIALGYDADLAAIYLLRKAQGSGTGRQLVRAVVERLLAEQHRSMIVWVLRDNQSRGFYEALGGEIAREHHLSIGGQDLPTVGYGYPSLAELAARLM